MADTPTKRGMGRLEGFDRSFGRGLKAYNQYQFARGGSGIPTAMAWAGMPNMANRGPRYGGFGFGGFGGLDALNRGGGGGGGGGGGNDPDNPNDPNNPGLPGDKFGKNLIPQWWKDWYLSQGQYGGVPPVQGLL